MNLQSKTIHSFFQDKLSFNKNGSLGGLLKQGDGSKTEGKSGGIARKQQLMQYQQQ